MLLCYVCAVHLLHPIKDGEEGRIPPLPKNIVEDHHPSPHQGLLVAEGEFYTSCHNICALFVNINRSPEQRHHRKPVSRRSPSSHSESDYSDDHRRPSSNKKRKRYSDSFDRPPSPATKRPRYLDRISSREENVTSRNQRSRSRSASPSKHGHPSSKRQTQQSPSGAVDANRKKQEKKIEKKYLKKRQSILEGTLTPTSKDKALRKLEKKKDKKIKKILSVVTSPENNEDTQTKVS